MNHMVDMCPLTIFEGGLKLLHKADDETVIWLESTATTALAKSIKVTRHTAGLVRAGYNNCFAFYILIPETLR